MPFLEMSYIYSTKRHSSYIFRLFINLLRTDMNKKCKNVYVVRIVTR